jgi:hypothetical protein
VARGSQGARGRAEANARRSARKVVDLHATARICDDGAVKRTTTSRFGIVLAVLAVVAGLVWLALHSAPAGPLRLRMTVSRETTFLTAPLTADGRVDYAAAWRAEQSNGVTPENNGAPLVYAALGLELSRFTKAERAGLRPFDPPFTDFETWASGRDDLFPDWDESSSPGHRLFEMALRALDADEDDETTTIWFDEIAPSLDAVVLAMAKGRFYSPDGAPEFDIRSERSPYGISLDSGICRTLARRARMRTRRGDVAGACADLHAALQFAMHLRSIGNWLHFEEADSGEREVWSCVRHLGRLISSDADPAPLASILAALRSGRDPAPPTERLAQLFRGSRIEILARFDTFLRDLEDECAKKGVTHNASPFEPDRIGLLINRRFDAFDDVLAAEEKWSERRRRFDDVLASHRITKTNVTIRAARQAMGLSGGPRLDEVPMEMMVSLEASMLRDAMVELLACAGEGDRALVELAALVFALENGSDPSSSDDLTPDLFDMPWRDQVTGSHVTFHRDADDQLVAQGQVVDFLEAFDLEREEPASEKK